MTKSFDWPTYNLQQTIARLPSYARRKYNAIIAQAADAEALARSAFARQQSLEGNIANIQTRLNACDPHVEGDTVAELKEEIDGLRVDIAKLDGERSKRQGIKANCDQILAGLQSFILADMGVSGVGPIPNFRRVAIVTRPRDGESLADAIKRMRAEIFSVKNEIIRLRTAPLTPQEIKQRIIAQVDDLARAGRPQLTLDSGKVEIQWPDGNPYAPPTSVRSAPPLGGSKLLCWLHRDEILRALTAGIDDIKDGVSQIDRVTREAELRAHVLALEYEEESLIVQAIDAGLEVHRRPGCSGYALLGVQIDDSLPVEEKATMEAAE